MRNKLIVASVLAGGAALAIYLYLDGVARAHSGGAPVPILVARESLAQGARLNQHNGAVKAYPSGYVHPEAIVERDVGEFLGRPVHNAIAAGQPILQTDFVQRSMAGDRPLSQVLPKGMRALTIPVDVSSSLGGLLRPGDRVDVMGTFQRMGGGQGERTTVTLLQKVEVLATGARMDAQSDGTNRRGEANFGNITVAVTLEEAELLAFSMSRGQLHVALRQSDDLGVVENPPEVDFTNIFEPVKRIRLQQSRPAAIERLRAAGR